jgi:small subunit ribosomal protein S5
MSEEKKSNVKDSYNSRRSRKRFTSDSKEFLEEVVDVARVTRVVKGGRRMRFLATVAVGNKKGRVGIGTGKSVEISLAIKKAVQQAKKNLITIKIVNGTIPFDKTIKYKAAKFILMPAEEGTGLIAGGALRKIISLSGITDIYTKSVGTSSSLVSAQASIKALSSFETYRKLI